MGKVLYGPVFYEAEYFFGIPSNACLWFLWDTLKITIGIKISKFFSFLICKGDGFMQKLTDEEIIYNVLKRYQDCCGFKNLPVLVPDRVNLIKAELLQKVEKYLLILNSPITSETEKDTLCNKGKTLYQKYCFQIKANPGIYTPRMAQKMDELLRIMSTREAKKVSDIREKKLDDSEIDLQELFEDVRSIRTYIGKPIDIFIKEILAQRAYTVVRKDMEEIYMTTSGGRYHSKECPYCKGKKLMQTTLDKAENIGLTPCKCMALYNEASDNMPSSMKVKDDKQYVTVFIDESVRENLWKKLDVSMPEKQAIFSYIICKGRLSDEKQISKKNTLDSKVMQAMEGQNPDSVAKEAILAVLFRLLINGYQDNVVIYTDNKVAKDYWLKSKESYSLAKLFSSVMVCFIPREENTKADRLTKESAFVNVLEKNVVTYLKKSKEYEGIKVEMDYVKKYFPDPRKNIPNLLEKLSTLEENMRFDGGNGIFL